MYQAVVLLLSFCCVALFNALFFIGIVVTVLLLKAVFITQSTDPFPLWRAGCFSG
jgi:hypothetical protein